MVKISLNTQTRECIADSIFLGFEGENQANKLVFSFKDGFVEGFVTLKLRRDDQEGTIELEQNGQTYELPIKASLVSKQGDVTFQLVITKIDGTVIKYNKFTMTVKDAIDTDAEMPDEYPSWQEIIAKKVAEINNATENANKVAEDLIKAKENGEFDGKDGVDALVGFEIKNGDLYIKSNNEENLTKYKIVNGELIVTIE